METSSRRVTLANGTSLHLRECGEGSPTTLLIHGWAVPGTVWEPVMARWPAGAGRVLAPDLRGTGFSSKPREGYTLEDDVGDILALIDELKLSDFVLVGHSKGGTIAQRVALARPELLRKLVLVCPVPASGIPLDEPTVGYFRSLCGPREGLTQLITLTTAKIRDTALLERLVDSMASVAIESLYGGLDAFRSADFGDRIGAITTPTLVIVGEADTVTPAAMVQPLVVDKIPGAALQVMPGVGHYPHIEIPDEFAGMLVAAVTSTAAGSTSAAV